MTVSLTWREGEQRSVESMALLEVLAGVGEASVDPVVVVIEMAGAAMHVVVGDMSGTVLGYSLRGMRQPEWARSTPSVIARPPGPTRGNLL